MEPTDSFPPSQPDSYLEDIPNARKNLKRKKLKQQMPAYTKEQGVPRPTFDGPAQSGLISTASGRSESKRFKETLKLAERRVHNFLKYADKIRAPLHLSDLEQGYNRGLAKEQIIGLQDSPTRAFSAQYYDLDDQPLFFYLGQRWRDGNAKGTSMIALDKQYLQSTATDLEEGIRNGKATVCDGFEGNMMVRYHQATQKLFSVIQPEVHQPEKRHAFEVGDTNPRTMAYLAEDEDSMRAVEERKGVLHLVQGWIQQAQPEKGLFLASPYTRSGNALGAINCWYRATRQVSLTLQIMFRVLFPTLYDTFQKAFDAGVWLEEDPGPWLGRAIVYKLQGDLHLDGRDCSPTASFPCGYFTGGEMMVPQLGAKLSYCPGHVCLFRSREIWHQVAKWEPTTHTDSNELTPGRIGNVSFFPQDSLNILQGKPAGWGKDTNYGRWEEFYEM